MQSNPQNGPIENIAAAHMTNLPSHDEKLNKWRENRTNAQHQQSSNQYRYGTNSSNRPTDSNTNSQSNRR